MRLVREKLYENIEKSVSIILTGILWRLFGWYVFKYFQSISVILMINANSLTAVVFAQIRFL